MQYLQFVKKYKLHHIFLWLLFFAGWYLFRKGDFPTVRSAVTITLIKVVVLALLVYLTNYLLIPALLYKKRYVLFSVLSICSILASGILKVYLITNVLRTYYNVPLEVFTDYKERIYDNIIPLFLLVSTGAAIKLVLDYIISQQKLTAISQEKAETELQYLRSQINPHFVFNTLNAIYFQIDKANTDARETLLQFSDLLRYQLYECNADTIPIEKEIAYLEDYVHLQQKRKDESYKVNFHCSPDVKNFQIVPLLLVPFVENAFKHISHFSNKPNSIQIVADMQQGNFVFSVSNTREPAQPANKNNPGGIGLKNVQRRLDLLYTGKHSLDITESKYSFIVNLTITPKL